MGGAAGSGMGGSSGVPSDAAMDAPQVDANLADTSVVETGGGEASLPAQPRAASTWSITSSVA